MSPTVEFPSGSKAVADSYRDEYPDYICPDDDRRLLSVTFTSDAPDWLLEEARRDAADARGESEEGAGQVRLTDYERSEIDFTKARASVPHARAVKGIAASEGVDDWLSYYDETLSVDDPPDVDFSSSNGTLDNAAAQAKKDALDADTGLRQYA